MAINYVFRLRNLPHSLENSIFTVMKEAFLEINKWNNLIII